MTDPPASRVPSLQWLSLGEAGCYVLSTLRSLSGGPCGEKLGPPADSRWLVRDQSSLQMTPPKPERIIRGLDGSLTSCPDNPQHSRF